MQNTQLYPVVEINGIWYSTNNVVVGGNYCKPILANIPSIKESVDVESRRFKISNVSLQFNNFPFEGVRFSDQLSETSLINKEATIYFKSQSDLREVFKGIVRRLSHDDEKVRVELEDLTEQKAHKDLPLADTYIQTESVPDKYKNKPTPIVYGEVDRSPVALDVDSEGDIILVADSNDDISGFVGDDPLYIHTSDAYLNAPMDAISPKTGEPMFRWIKDPDNSDDYIVRYNTGVQYSFSGNTITLNGSVSDAEGEQEEGNETGNAIGDNKIVVSQIAYPNVINAIRKKIDNRTGYYSVKHDYDTVTYFPQSGDYSVGDEVGHSNLPLIIRGIVFREHINDSSFWQQQVDSQDIVGEAMWETTNELDADGDIFQEGKCGCIIKLPIIEGIGKQDDDVKLSGSLGYVYADISAGFWDRELWDSVNIDIDFRIGGHKYQDHDGDVGMIDYHGEGTTVAGEFNTDFDYSATSGAFNGLSNDGQTYNSITGSDKTVIVHKSSSLLMYTRFHPNASQSSWNSGICFMQMQIKDLYVNQLDLVDNLLSQSFYANVKGRISPELYTEFAIPPFLQNPIDIIVDILMSELGLSLDQIDRTSYEEARDAHADWKFGFTVNKKISSKKLIEDIAKSTKCFPKFKNDGSFGFNTVKDSYTVEGDDSDYAGAIPIKELEVISHSFKKTKPEQIYKKVTVSYNKDYAQDSYPVTTDIDLGADDYYGIEDSADAHLEFESDYIRDEETANNLTSFLSEQYKNDHLIFSLKLPLQYLDLEVGDLVKFENLFQGVAAYGIDYTDTTEVNGQSRYPLFMVTSTTKNLDSVSIECMQLHHLEESIAEGIDYVTYSGDDIEISGNVELNNDNQSIAILVDDNYDYSGLLGDSQYFKISGIERPVLPESGDGDIVSVTHIYNSNEDSPNHFILTWVDETDGELSINGSASFGLADDEQITITLSSYDLPASSVTGDVNLDGGQSILDIVQMVNYTLGDLDLNQQQLENADINNDSIVNILDIVQLVNLILED